MRPPSPLIALALFCACTQAPTHEQQLQATLDALPELSDTIADHLDSARMTVRAPEINALPVDTTGSSGTVALLPCCGLKIVKRLQMLYETTWCQDPMADVAIGALPVAYRSAGTGSGVRHTKLTSLHGRRLSRPWWCHTSSGPWDAELVSDQGCHGGPIFTLSISTPGGLVILPPWVGGEEYKPLEVTVLQCTLLLTQRTPCGGLSNCNCTGSVCQQDCDCPVF